MKKAFLEHNGYFAIYDNTTKEHIINVDPGNIEGDIDWDIVEKQANEEGYTIF